MVAEGKAPTAATQYFLQSLLLEAEAAGGLFPHTYPDLLGVAVAEGLVVMLPVGQEIRQVHPHLKAITEEVTLVEAAVRVLLALTVLQAMGVMARRQQLAVLA